jgi:phosphatidylserine decarboxylase
MAEGPVKRGDEKGMFEFGGSTVVVLLQSGAASIDGAIYENTLQNRETVVRMGDKIGEKITQKEDIS